MGTIQTLDCRRCDTRIDPIKTVSCPKCFAPLDVHYDYSSIDLSEDSFQARPKSMWRYAELLPIEEAKNIVDLSTGFTPLHRCRNLGRLLGLEQFYVKNEGMNPTNSFKDRPASVAVSKAMEFQLSAVGAVSTGNLAAAVAAHAAKAAVPCYIFVPEGLEKGKLAQIESYGPKILSVKGTYDDANRVAYLAGELYGWAIANITMRPYYVEGSKTIAFEVCEQLQWRAPDHIVVAVGSGALMRATWKALQELKHVGLLDEADTAIHGAQATGCAPVANAFATSDNVIKPTEKPNTLAKSIAIGDPGDGSYAIEAAKKTGGSVDSVSDAEIQQAIRLLASKEGIFAEPAGAVPLALVQKLVENGRIHNDESVVCFTTGNGLKTIEAVPPNPKQWHSLTPSLQALQELTAAW